MEKIDLAIVGGGRKQSRGIIERCVKDVSMVIDNYRVVGIWIDRCGRWWRLSESERVGCALCGNRLVEINNCLEIGCLEVGCPIETIWPIASMTEFSPVGLAGWLEFSGVDLLTTAGLWSGVLQDQGMMPIIDGLMVASGQLNEADQFVIGFVGRKNYLPSRLCRVKGEELSIANSQLERVVQLKMMDYIDKYSLCDLGLIIIRANNEDWKIEKMVLQPEIHRQSWWAKLWLASGLGYDSIIKKVVSGRLGDRT